MIRSNLSDNVSSEFIQKFDKLNPKKNHVTTIYVYVEDDYDVPFWTNLLNQITAASDKLPKIKFIVTPPVNKGKKQVVGVIKDVVDNNKFHEYCKNNADKFGKNLIAGIDSDYEYLLPDQSANTNASVNQFIFKTNVYSIENYLCDSSGLNQCCIQSTKVSHIEFDFETFISQFSEQIFPLFIWHLYFYKTNRCDVFSMKDFNSNMHLGSMKGTSLNDSNQILAALKPKIEEKLSKFKMNYAKEIMAVEKLEQSILAKIIGKQNTYKFIQGHTIKDNFILTILKNIVNQIRAERINNIKSSSKDSTNSIHHYNKISSLNNIEAILDSNTSYYSCQFYGLLKEKISIYLHANYATSV